MIPRVNFVLTRDAEEFAARADGHLSERIEWEEHVFERAGAGHSP